MIKTSIKLQDLKRKIYIKAKTEPTHRFWGMYVHVCKMETLLAAYKQAKANNGAPGIDGVTFEQIEQRGKDTFLIEIQASLQTGTYRPSLNRIKEIPKAGQPNKVRKLGIPTIRDRVVQGALKQILEPVFEADFQDGSYGYRPKRTAHQAIKRVEKAIVQQKTRVLDLDLRSYFDTVRHDILLNKISERINDDRVMQLLKMIMRASGKKGVPQGGSLSPLLSNVYLNEVDKMLEKAKATTGNEKYKEIEYVRFADDLSILVSYHPSSDWIWEGINRRVREELAKLKVEINEDKTRQVNLNKGESFGFAGFKFRKCKTRKGKWGAWLEPKKEALLKLKGKIKDVFKRYRSKPLTRVKDILNPIIRGWVIYFKIGNSTAAFSNIKWWLGMKLRRHIRRSKGQMGYGWKEWSTRGLFAVYNIYNDFKVSY